MAALGYQSSGETVALQGPRLRPTDLHLVSRWTLPTYTFPVSSHSCRKSHEIRVSRVIALIRNKLSPLAKHGNISLMESHFICARAGTRVCMYPQPCPTIHILAHHLGAGQAPHTIVQTSAALRLAVWPLSSVSGLLETFPLLQCC